MLFFTSSATLKPRLTMASSSALLVHFSYMFIVTSVGLLAPPRISLSLVIVVSLIAVLYHGNPRDNPQLLDHHLRLNIIQWPLQRVKHNGSVLSSSNLLTSTMTIKPLYTLHVI
uniref:Uncharacterized protein n=1 Tax=Nelumbo nucifera TaxID=4432 RepID=A0A822XV14_NELNU|nr:TPA_asm: hypothetical protein HUJ06_025046 [Nelumbo nucifera]